MILKNFPGTNFVRCPNELVQSKALSMDAKGLLCTLLSYPTSWVIKREWLKSEAGLGISEHKLRGMLKELTDIKVLTKVLTRDLNGVITGSSLVVNIENRGEYKI